MYPIKRMNVFFQKADARVVPRYKFLDGLPDLRMYHHLDGFETYLAGSHKKAPDRRDVALFLKLESFEEFRLGDDPVFNEQIADGMRIGRKSLEDIPVVEDQGPDVIAGFEHEFSRPALQTDKKKDIL